MSAVTLETAARISVSLFLRLCKPHPGVQGVVLGGVPSGSQGGPRGSLLEMSAVRVGTAGEGSVLVIQGTLGINVKTLLSLFFKVF